NNNSSANPSNNGSPSGSSPDTRTSENAGTTGGSGASGGGGGKTVTIAMKNIAFNPASATVKVGQTVKWVNQDSAPHNVPSSSPRGSSSQISTAWTTTKRPVAGKPATSSRWVASSLTGAETKRPSLSGSAVASTRASGKPSHSRATWSASSSGPLSGSGHSG